jgi:hypothetical protein
MVLSFFHNRGCKPEPQKILFLNAPPQLGIPIHFERR